MSLRNNLRVYYMKSHIGNPCAVCGHPDAASMPHAVVSSQYSAAP